MSGIVLRRALIMRESVSLTEVLQNGDSTANRHFAKIKNACAERVVIFAK